MSTILMCETAQDLRKKLPIESPRTEIEQHYRVLCVKAIDLLEIAEQACEAWHNEKSPALEDMEFVKKATLIEGERNALIEVVKMFIEKDKSILEEANERIATDLI